MKSVTVAVFNSPSEAESLQSKLAAAGIHPRICQESGTEELLDGARPSAGVRIEVPRHEFEAALQLVYNWNADSDPQSTRVAPVVLQPVPFQKQVRPNV